MKLTQFLIIFTVIFFSLPVFSAGTHSYKVKKLSKKMLPKWKTRKEKLSNHRIFKNSVFTSPPTGELYLPAEFAKMEGVLIQPGLFDSESITYYKNMVKAIHDSGALPFIITKNSSEKQAVITKLLNPNNIPESDVKFLMFNYDSVWARDYGPWDTYLEGDRITVDMRYYSDRTNDDNIPIVLANLLDEDIYKANLFTEGGNFMSDGFGTCWVSQGVVNYNHNYNNMTETQVKNIYKNYMGCNTVTVVPPVPGEGTTHIDMFSKVVNQDTILVGFSKAEWGAEQREIDQLNEAAEIYKNSPKADGGKWNIIRIPMTFANYNDPDWGDYRVYYTHTNALLVNNYALIPFYGRGTDMEAKRIYEQALPEYTVVGIDSNAFIPYGGAIHCTTMQIPVKEEGSCGNGVIDEDMNEECEDNYLNSKSCSDFGFEGGKLKCNSCKFDYSECTLGEAPLSDNQNGICKDSRKVFSYETLEWTEPDYNEIENYEETESSCDGLDNDCDGNTDNNLISPDNSNQKGVCKGSKMSCDGVNGWVESYSNISDYEETESSCDGLDNDCDGDTDNNLIPLDNVNQKGVCKGSKMICDGVNGWKEDYSKIENYSEKDDNNDGLDNNCDGQIDESQKSYSGSSCSYSSSGNSGTIFLFLILFIIYLRKRRPLKSK